MKGIWVQIYSQFERLWKVMELYRKRPVIYSDQDHLKKSSTGFLHGLCFTREEIAMALDLKLREVESNIKESVLNWPLRGFSGSVTTCPQTSAISSISALPGGWGTMHAAVQG
ncbi:MAG: hypothetical protein Q8J68_11560 [Methanolobus sp.]|uniref:hypothetical protein n=1 Tax=Methanolobus sp. TaxID=1874737 RepID=UPI0027319A61|nr:hypothetical protein [Methanolobus sp.]MDP2217908.1 hypothetical protein [Methanolobus sp.]